MRILNLLDFYYVCNIIINNNKKSILKCKHTHNKKLSNLVPGYKVNPARFLHDSNKIIFNSSSHVLTEDEKSLLYKGLRFSMLPKKINYANFLALFELLYRYTVMFEMRSQNRDYLKNKLKDSNFSTLTSYSFFFNLLFFL